MHTAVAADDSAIFGDNFAFALIQRNAIFTRIGLDELNVVAAGNETQLHAFRLFGHRQIHAAGEVADFFFCQFAEREFAR
ncbi:MAG: hypothetical protein NVS9B14_18780 [Candidatus Acidiferrum sp.]